MVNYYTWHHGAFFVVSKPRPKPNIIYKRKNIIEEEFEVENWSRFIVLTSNQKSLTKISPFIIEKNN
jgi:hypothetical protein